jgi:hypothetical protein
VHPPSLNQRELSCFLIWLRPVSRTVAHSSSCCHKKRQSSPSTRHGGAWGERRYSSYSFCTSALDGGEWSASRPGRAFTPGERTSGSHCTGGWVGPRAGLYTEVRGKILWLSRGSNPDRPVVQRVVRHYTDWANRLLVAAIHWWCY